MPLASFQAVPSAHPTSRKIKAKQPLQDDQQNLPEISNDSSSNKGGESNALYVNTLNYNANDLTELRKLAESSPEIAGRVLENQERQHQRKENSYRLALLVAGVISLTLVAGGAYVLVGLGWFQTLLFIAILLGSSHVIRAVLKGEFSDTSWFGAILKGKPKPPEE